MEIKEGTFTVAQAPGAGHWWSMKGDGFLDPGDLAEKLLTPAPEDCMGAMMAYLWRRFGYPVHGRDDYKSLVNYTLTTPDPEVIVWCDPASRIALSFGYGYTDAMARQIRAVEASAPRMGDYDRHVAWLQTTPLYQRIACAVEYTLKDLLRPVFVRDVALNILGPVRDDSPVFELEPVDRYVHAGWGVGAEFDPTKEREAPTT